MVQSFAYKTLDGDDLSMDIDAPSESGPHPMLLWFRTAGDDRVPTCIRQGVRESKYALATVDCGTASFENALDAIEYVQSGLTGKLHAHEVDTGAIAIGSADLTLLRSLTIHTQELKCAIHVRTTSVASDAKDDDSRNPSATRPAAYHIPAPIYILRGLEDATVDMPASVRLHQQQSDDMLELFPNEKRPYPGPRHQQRPQSDKLQDILQYHFTNSPGQAQSADFTSTTFTESRPASPTPSIDDSTTTISDSETTTTWDDEYDAEQQWAEQVHEMTLVLNLMIFPLVGKYFGRQFALWSWGKFIAWQTSYRVVTDKKMQRLTSAVVAGLS